MPTILGIESTAHTFGIGIVRDGKILSNVKRTYTTESGGIIPTESAKFHCENKHEIYFEALEKAGLTPQECIPNQKVTRGKDEIDAIAFSQGPGLAPCLLEGMKFAKELSKKFMKPIVPVNHCIAHLEIGKTVLAPQGCTPRARNALQGAKARDAVMLYVSGANTQIIAYSSGKYRIFGETLDVGVGNFIDNFARYSGIGFPGGPAIEKLARDGKKYIELPYKVKGMDIALSGVLTNLRQKIEKLPTHSRSQIDKIQLIKNTHELNVNDKITSLVGNSKKSRAKRGNLFIDYTLQDLCYSMQETVFAMLVETAERALAHTGKKELLLGGGVACNSRLQEMCRIMCKERGAKLFVPEKSLLVDNGAMIAYLGEIMFAHKVYPDKSSSKISTRGKKNLDKIDIHPRERTDEVVVSWK
ncbi:MAG: UGMP family protein [Nanoarchaeota archaeon]